MHQKTSKIPFWVASDATAHDLPALWNTSCEPSMQNGECHLFPCQQQNTNLDHKLAVFMLDKQMTIYQLDQEDFQSFCIGKLSTDTLYDTFGVLQDAQPYNQRTVITDHPIQHGSIDANTMYILAAFQNCTVVYHYDIDKDHCRCTIRDDAASRMLLASVIANAIDKNTLQALGRHVSIFVIKMHPLLPLRRQNLEHQSHQHALTSVWRLHSPESFWIPLQVKMAYQLCSSGNPDPFGEVK